MNTKKRTQKIGMGLLAMVVGFNLAIADETQTQINETKSLKCTARKYVVGKELVEETLEKPVTLSLEPGNEAKVDFGDYSANIFVCNLKPVSELVISVQDRENNYVGISDLHVNQPYFGHTSYIPQPSGKTIEISLYCDGKN